MCHHHIPNEAIVEGRNPREVEEGNARANPTSEMPSGRTLDSLKSQRPINIILYILSSLNPISLVEIFLHMILDMFKDSVVNPD